MDQSRDNSVLYNSLYAESPSIRTTTSKHVGRFFKKSLSDSFFKTPASVPASNLSIYQTPGPSFLSSSTFLSVDEETNEEKEENQIDALPCSLIYTEFFDYLMNMDSIVELLEKYEDVSIDHLNVTKNMITAKVQQINEKYNLVRLFSMLRLERNSWRLLRRLLEVRLKNDDEMMIDDEDIYAKLSERKLIEKTFEKDQSLTEMHLAILWLEENELEDQLMDEQKENIEFYSQGPVPWENTLHELKKQKREGKMNSLICSSLDSDAPIREKRPVHHLDKEDDDRLYRQIFRLVRSGQFDEGKRLAERQGHHWLSAVLDGMQLYHDPNYEQPDVSDDQLVVQPIEGNITRDLWKLVCWKSAKVEGVLHSEKALFAILSGNLQNVLTSPFCQTWEDGLWAYLRCSLDAYIESHLRDTIVPNPEYMPRSTVDLPDEYWANMKDIREIFSALEATNLGVSSLIEEKCHHVVQRHLITDDLNALIEHMHHWSCILIDLFQKKIEQGDKYKRTLSRDDYILEETEAKIIAPHMIRFFTHLVLALKNFGQIHREELCTSIIEKYIIYLIHNQQNQMVTRYCSFLPKKSQIEMMSKLMSEIENPSKRKMILIEAKAANLDINEITTNLVNSLRTKLPEREALSELVSHTTEEDKKKINALDWLLMEENDFITCQYEEALKQANALMRIFLLMRKIEAAFETFKKLPIDIIDKVYKEKNVYDDDLLTSEPNFHEYLCYKVFLEAYESFIDWQRCYFNTKPKEPASLPTDKQVRFVDKVAYEHMKKEYEQEMAKWKELVFNQGNLVADKIFKVLQFPCGWMVDIQLESQDDDNDEPVIIDEDRLHCLNELRKMYIPQLTYMAYNVLNSSKNYSRCLHIADLIADEELLLYKNFNKEDLKQLIRKFRETGIEQMLQTKDPFGQFA